MYSEEGEEINEEEKFLETKKEKIKVIYERAFVSTIIYIALRVIIPNYM